VLRLKISESIVGITTISYSRILRFDVYACARERERERETKTETERDNLFVMLAILCH